MKKVYAKTIFKETSPVSGIITIRDNGTVRELFVKGVKQSAWSEDEHVFEGTYWRVAVSIPFELPSESPKFLVIGLGGGTIPKLLSSRYPSCEVVCLEIDPMIIDIASNLFSLKNYKNVKIIKANANNWISRNFSKYQNYFDGIFLDAFFGDSFSLNTQFVMIEKIQKMLQIDGVMITNRIYNDYEEKVDAFIKEISDIFLEQTTHIVEGYSGNDNIIIFSKNTPL